MRPIDSKLQQEPFNPFLTHAFLSSLEESGSATPRTGWSGAHILVENAAGRLLACAPAWLKSHSQGEYVFDHGWADAYERAGGAYYPKLQVAVPFTPVTGRRLLLADDAGAAETAALLQGLRAVVRKTGASSIHITFPTRPEWEALGTAGLLQRTGQQFHFFNRGYGTFDDFLADLASRKRKAIRKERATALAPGIEIEWVTGSDLKEAHWDAFFAFYMDTGSRKWGRPYLTRAFFSLLGERLADRVLLVMAKRGGKYIGGALNLIGDHALYGRNWGAIEEHPCLHFEACYYQAIDFAISKGLKRVEAGAQGEHKLARGYRPVPTYSAHEFANASLARAVSDYLERERRHVAATIEAYEDYAPFRRS
ncbi:MAG: N-acetyltransferase [Hyphomicrobiales bacterium]|nr:N-acetyltransferase [Rhodoblastus sp.]MCB1525262.1 N-acetyltransferase [Rhodoblastus sp.]MCB9999244.1 N-acetyltransferase [Methylobacteriaceae bacterium]MCC2099990.1 N-acetyltransferase [Hyphomicrobiales bacterium]MCC2105768.1 N-acetyltransferase [Hyphomicrobiales bacterium]